MTKIQKNCEGCGKCCQQGGPALHTHDLLLVRNGQIPITSLITIRKGELANNPLTGMVQPVSVELVKISGAGRRWDCCFHDVDKGCTIYPNRPQACRALKCWDTEEILALVEKDTLSRLDILPGDHFILPAIREQERICPCHDLQQVYAHRNELTAEAKSELETRANDEMRFRVQVVADFNLRLCDELFYLGRPFFQLLQAFGVRASDAPSGIRLHWR